MWKYKLTLLFIRLIQILCMNVIHFLRLRMPRHVAIIMDGNRRYARRGGVQVEVGYRKGHDNMMNIVKCCTLLGVPEISVYAFSIENFKRDEREVAAIMHLAKLKLLEIINENELAAMKTWGIRVRVVGRQELLSGTLQALGARASLATKYNRMLQLNIAFPYTGRDEISRAATCIIEGVRAGQLSEAEVNSQLISQVLELGEPQLLIRTSGEVRLSDYMLWQVSNTVLYFTKTLWPDFTIWHLLKALFHYMRHAPKSKPEPRIENDKTRLFLKNIEAAKLRGLETFAT